MAAEGREISHRDSEANEDGAEMLFSKRRCCFCIPYSYRSSSSSTTLGLNWWQKVRVSDRDSQNDGSLWDRGINAFMKLREWSEIVAGPRWKTFIRRFNRGGRQSGKFQYDPLSYSLNFDKGPGNTGNSDEEDDFRFRNFSSRYATPPLSNKSSVELGKDGANFV